MTGTHAVVWGVSSTSQEKLVKCPECVAEGKVSRVYGGDTYYGTCMPFESYYDEDGKYHMHNPNTRVYPLHCSNGHAWKDRRPITCWCGWSSD